MRHLIIIDMRSAAEHSMIRKSLRATQDTLSSLILSVYGTKHEGHNTLYSDDPLKRILFVVDKSQDETNINQNL